MSLDLVGVNAFELIVTLHNRREGLEISTLECLAILLDCFHLNCEFKFQNIYLIF